MIQNYLQDFNFITKKMFVAKNGKISKNVNSFKKIGYGINTFPP